ncbi:hypothetical protein Hanom_Chr16g01473411 [Helianthus anomalus]
MKKGTRKNGTMQKNRTNRQNLHNRRLHTGRAQPTRPRAEPPAGNHPVQVTGHGPCSADTPPCPGFCFNSIIFVTGALDTAPW